MAEQLKAFFSHSSRDAELVRAVGREVGRPFVVIDYFAFGAGDELLIAIERAIAESSIFLFFASRPALASLWVGAELTEARYHAAFGRLSAVVVIATDDSLRASDMPTWLQRYRYISSHAARPIARAIRSTIDDAIRARQNAVFLARPRETALLQEALLPVDGSPPPKVVALTGLTGIGRQTLARRIGRDVLGYPRTVRVEVESGDSINDLAAKVANLVEPIATAADAQRVTDEIEAASHAAASRRISSGLVRLGQLNELVLLYDKGGILNPLGQLEPPVTVVLDIARQTSDLFVFLIMNRRPSSSSTVGAARFPIIDVRPLSESDVRRLIGLAARAAQLSMNSTQVSRLAATVRGYPPAVTFAIELMRSHGADGVLAERDRIVAFRNAPFVQYLRQLGARGSERDLLRVLAANTPLPLVVLTAVSAAAENEVGRMLMRLIDASLVIPDDSGWYRIADPVADAIRDIYQSCTREEYNAVAKALDEFLMEASEDGSYLELARVRFRALVSAGSQAATLAAAGLISDWIRLARQFYDDRDYARAVELAAAAVETRPENADVRMTLIKALIKQESYAEAGEQLAQLRRTGFLRETLYLSGFLERNLGNHLKAIDFFERAYEDGQRGVAIHRELANSYFAVGNFEKARWHINEAQTRQRDNPFIIDLLIRIAIAQGDENTARDLLEILAKVDRPEFVAHRRSRVEDAFGATEAAYAAAKTAVGNAARPPFEILAQLILCEIKLRRHEDAQLHLQQLAELYPGQRRDVQIGLRCRFLIVRGQYEDALTLWEQLEDTSSPVHLQLRRSAVEGLLANTYVPAERRSEYEDELRRLDTALGGASVVDVDLELLPG